MKTTKYEVNDAVISNVVAGETGEETIVFDLNTGQLMSLNASGSRFWQHIQQGLGREEIIEKIGHEFEAECAAIEADYDELVSSLIKRKLVREI